MNLQTQCSNPPNPPADNETVAKKPFRSELNLVLAYPNRPSDSNPSSSTDAHNAQITPPLPTPMEIMNPLSHANPLLLQNLPSPFPSPIPSSPVTPPTNFKTNEAYLFEKAPDYAHLNFPPINDPLPMFASNNSIFCTVSAPSTPASDRKCIDKFCINETNNDNPRVADKKKAKRVSILNTKDEPSDKAAESQEANNVEASKDGESKAKQTSDGAANNHHTHAHRNHSHLHPKRRMSLDNNVVSCGSPEMFP